MKNNYELTIPFYDIDPMQVTWHGNYIKYLEQARCAWLKEHQMTYTDMANLGYAFPIVELKIKYIRPTVFEQKISIEMEYISSNNLLIFKYQIKDAETKQLLTKAETKQMCVDLKTKKSLFEIPDIILKKLENS